jgi:hypothetical protein
MTQKYIRKSIGLRFNCNKTHWGDYFFFKTLVLLANKSLFMILRAPVCVTCIRFRYREKTVY